MTKDKNVSPDQNEKRRRGSGVTIAYETLKQEILNLTLTPGSPIDEGGLAKRFNMSRTPIREALVRLSSDGLVVALKNHATIVAPIDYLELSQFFEALTLMYRVTTRLAAEHHTSEELISIRELQDAYADAVAAKDVDRMILTNLDFHVAIAKAGKNRYYTELFTKLLNEGRRLLRLYYSSFNYALPTLYLDEHEEMIHAISARDTERADKIALVHANQIVNQIREYISKDRRSAHSINL